MGLYLKQLLDLFETPDIKKSFDANNKWDVVEQVLNRHLGGARELSQRTKMAEVAACARPGSPAAISRRPRIRSASASRRAARAHAEAWLAAYRLTDEGKRFPGVTENLRWAVGLPARDADMRIG